MKTFLTIAFGLLMIAGGINHFVNPSIYDPFIPGFLPKLAVNYFIGIVEMVLGIGALVPRFRRLSTLGILALMIAFLPLHAIDVFRSEPAIGSHLMALIRLPLQFLLIYWAWSIFKASAR